MNGNAARFIGEIVLTIVAIDFAIRAGSAIHAVSKDASKFISKKYRKGADRLLAKA